MKIAENTYFFTGFTKFNFQLTKNIIYYYSIIYKQHFDHKQNIFTFQGIGIAKQYLVFFC